MSNEAAKVNQAIRACICQCYGSDAILAKFVTFLDSLRRTEDWNEADVRLVEASVRRLLAGLLVAETLDSPIETPVRKAA